MKNRTFKHLQVGSRQQRPRRRGTARLFVLGSALVASTAAGANAATLPRPLRALYANDAAQQPARRFDIPAGPLGDAITAFEQVTGVTVSTELPEIRDINSPGVSGLMTPDQALRQLLVGTGVTYSVAPNGAVLLKVGGVQEFVAVTGSVPTVSSPKYTQPLRDIPQTINVVSQSVMQAQGVTTLRDALRNVVGITFQAGEGGVPAGDQMTVRGFSARTDLFVDGVRDFGGYSRDSFNLEQVEVAKGPSSAIAGRGSTGASINQVSKAPHLGSLVAGSVGAGNAEYVRTTVDMNQQLGGADSGMAFRVNAMFTNAGVPGREVVQSERWGVAPSLGVGLNGNTKVTLGHLHLAQDNVPEYGLPWVPVNTNPELAAYSNGKPPVDSSNFYGLSARDYEDTTTDITTAQVDHAFSERLTLRNITRYGRNYRDSVITAPRFASVDTSTAINRQLQSRDMTDTIAANTTSVVAHFDTGAIAHAISTGLELSREGSENFARTGPTAPTADLYAPNPADPYPGPITRSGARTDGTASSAGIYMFDTVEVGERFEFTGGVRWDRFDVDFDSVAATGVSTPFERMDEMVSWRGGAVYKPVPNASLYLGYATAFNPSAEGLALTAATVDLEPEKTRTLEGGVKWDAADGRYSLTAALFRTAKTNARTPGVNPGDPPTVLAGEQHVNGFEAGVSGRINERWTLMGGYAFMRSTIEASNTPAEVDNALALVPEHSFNLWTTYELPFRVSIGGGAQYMDAVFRNATNVSTVPSYWVVQGLVSYPVNTNLTLRLNLQNLLDEKYVDRVGGGHFIPGPGRQVMLSLDVGL